MKTSESLQNWLPVHTLIRQREWCSSCAMDKIFHQLDTVRTWLAYPLTKELVKHFLNDHYSALQAVSPPCLMHVLLGCKSTNAEHSRWKQKRLGLTVLLYLNTFTSTFSKPSIVASSARMSSTRFF